MASFTDDQLKLLDKKNLDNMVFFYSSELQMIAQGQRATVLLPQKKIALFRKHGILEIGRRRKQYIVLSQKGRDLIEADWRL